jgi:hypothetical protein
MGVAQKERARMMNKSFGDLYSEAYSRAKVTKINKALSESLELRADLGHPDFSQLQIGDTVESKGVVFFLDIRGFTKMSFALPNEELVWILQALTETSVRAIEGFGGHVIEFTGDGVMAVFGDFQAVPQIGAFVALQTASFLMLGIRDYVNPQLKQYGTEPVRTAVGMEFGTLLWSCNGANDTTQVKPISEVTFLAGKLSTSKFTDAWQAKVGAGLAAWTPPAFKEQAKKYGFTLNKTTYSRELFLFKWEEFAKSLAAAGGSEVRKRLLASSIIAPVRSAARIAAPSQSSSSSPRVLKDQPFF